MPSGLPNLGAMSVTPYFTQYKRSNGSFASDIPKYAIKVPNATMVFSGALVGDSDSSPSDSDDEYHLDVATVMRPKAVTVYGTDGCLKGSQLVEMAHSLSQAHSIRIYNKSGVTSTNKGSASIKTGADLAAFAGAFAASKTDIELDEPLAPAFYFGKRNKMDASQKFKLTYTTASDGTKIGERLHVSVELAAYFQKELGFANTDLSCKQMVDVVAHFRSKFPTLTDAQIATRQLNMLKSGKHLDSKGQDLDRFVTYMNAYMFGVEASRVNATFTTGLMTLKLITAGKMTYEQALSEDGYGGRFPMAVLMSGSGNFKARKRLIEHVQGGQDPGMKMDRRHPQWLAIALKEGALIKTYMKHQGVLDRDATVKKQKKAMKNEITELLSAYFVLA
jgi:hypothetical protein